MRVSAYVGAAALALLALSRWYGAEQSKPQPAWAALPPRPSQARDPASVEKLRPIRTPQGLVPRAVGKEPLGGDKSAELRDRLTRFVRLHAGLLAIDEPGSVYFKALNPAGFADFEQFVRGVPVEGGGLRVFLDRERENVLMVNNDFVPGAQTVDVQYEVKPARASAIALADAIRESDASIMRQYFPRLLIHTFQSGRRGLAWKVTILQPARGAESVGHYYVDAHSAEVEREEGAVE